MEELSRYGEDDRAAAAAAVQLLLLLAAVQLLLVLAAVGEVEEVEEGRTLGQLGPEVVHQLQHTHLQLLHHCRMVSDTYRCHMS